MSGIKISLLTVLYCLALNVIGQNQVGINTILPDQSSILDVTSVQKGILLPRMTSALRLQLLTPADGLILYDSTTANFKYYFATNWRDFSWGFARDSIGDADSNTHVLLGNTIADDSARFLIAGFQNYLLYDGRIEWQNSGGSVFLGEEAGISDSLTDNRNVFIGYRSGTSNGDGINNIALGSSAFEGGTTGQNNVALGDSTLLNSNLNDGCISIGRRAHISYRGNNSIAIGEDALINQASRALNIAIGKSALQNSLNGTSNVAIGSDALVTVDRDRFNTAVGFKAGENTSSSDNVFIGFQAGGQYSEVERLAIANSNSKAPLIYGNFKRDSVIINNKLHVEGNIYYVRNLRSVSDRRKKENLLEEVSVLKKIASLQAYRFNLKADIKKKKEYGLMAQDVQSTFPLACKPIFEGKYLGVDYTQLIPIAVEGVKEQAQLLEKVNTMIEELEKALDEMSKIERAQR